MNQYPYFSVEPSRDYSPDSKVEPDALLDDLLHQKSRIFASKLEVLTASLVVRIHLLEENLSRINDGKERAETMLASLDRQARYHVRDHRDKGILYQTLFRLEEERRSQAVECWRDVVMVLRDFLGVWEAHEQSQARAMFLENVGD